MKTGFSLVNTNQIKVGNRARLISQLGSRVRVFVPHNWTEEILDSREIMWIDEAPLQQELLQIVMEGIERRWSSDQVVAFVSLATADIPLDELKEAWIATQKALEKL